MNQLPSDSAEEVLKPNSRQLEVINVTGLDLVATISITQHLQQLNLPSGLSGEIVFEFTVSQGRVGRVMLDESTSTLTVASVVEMIKRSLLTWQVSQALTSTVHITLRIQP
jgi:Ca-activated chloride channel family protein